MFLLFISGILSIQHRFALKGENSLLVVNRCRVGSVTNEDLIELNKTQMNADSNSSQLVKYVNQVLADKIVMGSDLYRKLLYRYTMATQNLREERHGTYFKKGVYQGHIAENERKYEYDVHPITTDSDPTDVKTLIITSENEQKNLYNSTIPRELKNSELVNVKAVDDLGPFARYPTNKKNQLSRETKLVENMNICKGMIGKFTRQSGPYLSKNKLFIFQVSSMKT